VTFPKGTTYNAASYNIGTAYISATTQLADACYRWISVVAQNPGLFSDMPARRSLLSDPSVTGSQGADTVAFYKQMDTLMQDPNTISVPGFARGGGGNRIGAQFFYQLWLYQAFDSYVLQNGDLNSGLKTAEGQSKGLADCTASIPPFDPTSQDSRIQYMKAYAQCVIKVDPSFSPLFRLAGAG